MFRYEKEIDFDSYRKFQKETSSKEKFLYETTQITQLLYLLTDKVETLQQLVSEDDSFANEEIKQTLNLLNFFTVESLFYSEDLSLVVEDN